MPMCLRVFLSILNLKLQWTLGFIYFKSQFWVFANDLWLPYHAVILDFAQSPACIMENDQWTGGSHYSQRPSPADSPADRSDVLSSTHCHYQQLPILAYWLECGPTMIFCYSTQEHQESDINITTLNVGSCFRPLVPMLKLDHHSFPQVIKRDVTDYQQALSILLPRFQLPWNVRPVMWNTQWFWEFGHLVSEVRLDGGKDCLLASTVQQLMQCF